MERVQEEKEITGTLKENGYPSTINHSDFAVHQQSIITNLSDESLHHLDIQVLFRPLMTLHQLLVHRKGVVYSISCTVCPKGYGITLGRLVDP